METAECLIVARAMMNTALSALTELLWPVLLFVWTIAGVLDIRDKLRPK